MPPEPDRFTSQYGLGDAVEIIADSATAAGSIREVNVEITPETRPHTPGE